MSDGGSLPGWYPDPGRADLLRWWDGRTWTGFTMLRPYATARRDLAEEVQARTWAYAAIAVWAVLLVVVAAANVHTAPQIRELFDWFRTVSQHAGTPGYVRPPQPHVSGFGYFGILAYLPRIAFAIWLYRSATTAKGLGYPARLNPGLGGFSVIIPVVDLWMPAQCMMGCLPVGHPMRGRIPWLWALYDVVGLVLAPAPLVVGFFSQTAGYLCVIPLAIAYLVLLVAAYGFIRAADEDHRRASVPASAS